MAEKKFVVTNNAQLKFKDIEQILSTITIQVKEAKKEQKDLTQLNLQLNSIKILRNQLLRRSEELKKQPQQLSAEEILALITARIKGEEMAADYYLEDNIISLAEETIVRTDFLKQVQGKGLKAFLD